MRERDIRTHRGHCLRLCRRLFFHGRLPSWREGGSSGKRALEGDQVGFPVMEVGIEAGKINKNE